jgi:hypothetical protein
MRGYGLESARERRDGQRRGIAQGILHIER